ncbi:MAG: hypothetical protein SFU98_21645 [Leptospiraceae bacterium]|nr:hypothetical protein [Leptospiraceae bacterium]
MNLILHIADGSLVVFRKSDYSFLSNLDKEQLEDFELFGGGDLLGNDELDIHLSVEQLIKTHGTIKLKKAS